MDSIKINWSSKKPAIYCDVASNNAREIFSNMPVELVTSPLHADLLWLREGYHNFYPLLKTLQAINHIPEEGIMTTKGNLSKILHEFANKYPEEKFSYRDFYPETYCLFDSKERQAFLNQLPAKDNPDNLWILKPSILSKGRGVKIIWNFDELKKELQNPTKNTLEFEGKQFEFIIQRYIKNVLLLEGKKSELRIYWLIASLDPLLVLFYNEGTARVTLQEYKLADFDNPLIHITNIYQQKKHAEIKADTILKWSFSQLQDYLTKEKNAPRNFITDSLKPFLKQCLAYVVRASIQNLKQHPNSGLFFGLYGADFILDENLKPWLTEIQMAPGLSFDDPIKKEIIPPLLKETINIILEIQKHKHNFEAISTLSAIKNYEWLIKTPANW